MSGTGPGPFRWFRASVVRQPCPDCGRPTATGFDRNDTPRPPTRCTACSGEAITAAVRASAAELGYPVTEQAPCAVCRQPARVYGPHGRPHCPACRLAAAARRYLEAD